jgi:hypothetical protein
MYREAASPDPSGLPPPELVVTLADRNARSSVVVMFHIFGVPSALAVLTATFAPPLILPGVAAGAAYATWQWRRRSHQRRIFLRVASRELSAHEGRRELARIRLDDLEDVVLDSKTIRPVIEGASVVPATRFIDSKEAGEIDVARIALVAGDRTVLLNEEHIAHMTATESLGKIRAFLRKHDWVPLDERPT